MAVRRYNGSTNDASSPSKEDIRRRLFENGTPQKNFHKLRQKANLPQFSKDSVFFFLCIGIGLIVLVHCHLLRVALHDTEPVISSTAQASDLNIHTTPPRGRKTILSKRNLTSLQGNDWDQYTIRINTWRRPEQLMLSVDWHSRCPGVAEIQIIWCDADNDPPHELFDYDKVVIERHNENSLNERFRIINTPPTLGILSIDDDVLRPCEAIDSGFFKWTKSPDRMVGFDGRLHVEHADGSWQYGYMSTTEKANRYSMSLTRYCFLHRDYLHIYINELPEQMLESIAANFNCEDVAMSFLISSLTNGMPPLLADAWAIKSMVKLFVEKKISGGHDHKHLRDECVDSFAQFLGLKDDAAQRRLKSAKLYREHDSFFECGDSTSGYPEKSHANERNILLESELKEWHRKGRHHTQTEVHKLMSKTAFQAYKQGMIEKTDPWKDRFLMK